MMRPPVVRGITIAAFFAGLLALAPSRTAAADEGVATEALAPGSWSVQFSVQPNFTLGSYSGSTLSLKRHLGSGNAIRFGVSVVLDNAGDDRSDVSSDTSFTRTETSVFDRNLWSTGVVAHYLWYSRRAAPVHAYWGLGPTISWQRGHDERQQTSVLTQAGQPTSTSTVADDIKSRGWQAGVGGALGVEWLIARRVGLLAEYGTAFTYTRLKNTRVATATLLGAAPVTTRNEQKLNRWNLSGSGGRLGVSVYY